MFVTSHAELLPQPPGNRVITYQGSYQGKQAVTIMFANHSGMKDMLQIRYLINLRFHTEAIIAGPSFCASLKDQHVLQVNPQMLCYSLADFVFISLLASGKQSHVNSMYMVLNQILGEINFCGFTDAGQLRIWSAV